MLKTVFKIIRGQLLPEKMRFENLNLCRYLKPELPPMRDFGSLYFLNHYTFVYTSMWNYAPLCFRGYKSSISFRILIRGVKVPQTKVL
jgi:hypothetical protein